MKSKLRVWLAELEALAKQVEQRRTPPMLIVHFLNKKVPPPPYPPGSIEVRFVQPKAKRDGSKEKSQ